MKKSKTQRRVEIGNRQKSKRSMIECLDSGDDYYDNNNWLVDDNAPQSIFIDGKEVDDYANFLQFIHENGIVLLTKDDRAWYEEKIKAFYRIENFNRSVHNRILGFGVLSVLMLVTLFLYYFELSPDKKILHISSIAILNVISLSISLYILKEYFDFDRIK